MSFSDKFNGDFLQQFHSIVDLVLQMDQVRASSSKTLSPEMTRLLVLVIFDGYQIGGPYSK